ncbi:1-acyl-sn-glycerol-3-phosphate acyltransferases [Geoalkalibacter ferrihydriticus]|uniref:1-acyl-sn-glycerol-3-phosphate acyltransferases n=1 Tax=Geoalkalibacter ferrihydriticus TaxID=392333 RepID=A0A1G9U7I4_9BACT|nr:AMP-binding protein [Geoalkalibacter ferrihydriticus]SDM55956.1 1-acyl-sn-glycerol-3-phosphate acyltransferases [Geoalkalibacter ferrihydriticus]
MVDQAIRDNPQQAARDLIKVLQDVVAELHPAQTPKVEFDSSLDRDLGLDSMARMELLSRLEKHFSVRLEEEVVAEAETPRDLLEALLGGAQVAEDASPERIAVGGTGTPAEVPKQARTLVEAFEWHLERHPDHAQVRFYADEGEGQVLSYKRLWEGARAVAAGLQWRGLQAGSPVAIMLPTSADYLFAFLGILLAGGIPVPLYPPVRRTQLESHLRRQQAILSNCAAVTLITLPEALPFARLLKAQLSSLKSLVTVGELAERGGDYSRPAIASDDTAFLQYTSGSTGNPKGVVLSHANLLANIRALGKAVEVGPGDVIVSWLPLYHDMGLIGTWLAGLYFAVPVVLLSPLDFLGRPKRWLWSIHRYQGTLSPAPNFAYEICLTKLKDEDLAGLDLSSWRGAFNGAEPVSALTLERFCERFADYGLRREAVAPVYGLAENTVGLAFPPLGRGPLVDRVEREALTRSGKAIPAKKEDEHALLIAACGRPLEGHEIRIVDGSGRELPDRREGRVQFRGPSATSGYYRNPEETRRLFDGDWLNTGDLGYLADGDIYLTGRSKDLIIIGGRNIYPQELEEAVGGLTGIRKGNVVVFGSPDPATGSERLVVVAETRESDPQVLDKLRGKIKNLAVDLLETPPDDLLLVPPHSVLKTSSGKIRRSACRELYERGELGKREKLWRQNLRLALSTFAAGGRRSVTAALSLLYAGYLWALFYLAAALATLVVLALPRHAWNWRPLRALVRLAQRLSGLSLKVEGLEHLPPEPCVLVANHASYLDAYALVAALPMRLSFVAKAELNERKILGFLLRRIGTEFVERFDPRRAAADAGRISGRVRTAGGHLLFFAEGTFTRVPGLRTFRLGAFTTAAAAKLPVVPVAIRGTRFVLREGSWFPRHGAVSIRVGEPIQIEDEDGDAWDQALKLRKAARRFILRHCGEPDLGGAGESEQEEEEAEGRKEGSGDEGNSQ